MTHTPGPWHWEREGGGETVVPCHTLKGPTVLCRWWETVPDPHHIEPGDARLIAAAPDMLEALEKIAEGDQMEIDFVMRGEWENLCEYQRSLARAAIAKAAGHGPQHGEQK